MSVEATQQRSIMSEAVLVIKLIQNAPNGYVPLDQLRKQYHEKYGKHLKRTKIRKWLGALPGIYIGNSPVKDSISIREKYGLTRHKKADEEANLVIKLIQDAPNGYVPLNKLRKEYHEKYGKHLEQSKILKWIRSLPGVYIDNSPVTLSIHCRVDDGLAPLRNTVMEGDQSMTRSYAAVVTRRSVSERPPVPHYQNDPVKDSISVRAKQGLKHHKKADEEANLVIKLIQDAPNGYVPLNKLRKEYHEKYDKHLERNKIRKWLETLPGVYIDNKDSICIGAKQREKKKAKKHKAKLERPLPIRRGCYYGMANHQVNTQSKRKCIMHFGSTSKCKTKYWPGNKKKQLSRDYNVGPFSRAIISGYIANKVKKTGGQKAARKTRNLARLRKKHNPTTADPTRHAKQRYKERGLDSSPIYKSLNDGKEAIVMTYVPIQRRNYSDAKNSSKTIQLEVDRMSRLSKKSDLPKSKLSSRDACLFKLSSQETKKEEWRRRSERKKKAYAKQCIYPLGGHWTPLSINTKAPQNIYIHGRRNNRRRGHKSAPRRSTKKKTQKRSKKKSSVVPGRAF